MTSTKKIKKSNSISEVQYLTINNTKQYLLIRGENVNNPILLFLHGGPGASATAMLRKYNSDLEKYFVFVYWDQRNVGKSYDKTFTKDKLKVKKFIQDIDSIVSYLKNRFNANKIFLVGHSWGSRIGFFAIQKYPENFIAYVGIGQEVSSYEGELASYQYTLNKAKELNNVNAIKALENMGAPQSGDYSSMYKNGYGDFWKQKKWLMKIDDNNSSKKFFFKWLISIWFSREYSFRDLIKCIKSVKFSSDNIIYDQDYHNLDFNQFPEVKIPVFFISGKRDYITPWPLVEKYCDILEAPYKEFILYEESGHIPYFEEPDKFNKEIIRIYKLAKNKNPD